ncbi:hypothetical protein E5K00_06575 [Hymenobacter aquaticus]|uniref:DUF4234 domain-containing protein n=1 Tax=Hymenobacter aquaticus TaxID=1867101 RepID=A0A4Z0Q745_9BACT|nr:hypothetical protein [Hymenobacter aquaticus]TGE24861.1 hypothetical protein E5K00_06575 [Hymenobacter aquaticus]
METRRPFTRRNVISAAILGVVTLSYWLVFWSVTSESQHLRRSTDGEAAGLVLLFLFWPALFASAFFLGAFFPALRRGSPPVNYWVPVLGLLPTILLLLFCLYAIRF